MPRPTAPAPVPPRRARWLLPVAVACAMVIAFVAGRITAVDSPQSGPVAASGERPPEVGDLRAPESPPLFPPPSVSEGRPADPVPAQRVAITPEIAQRVTTEAKAQMEAQRHQIVSRCWRSTGADKRGGRVSITYNVTFDAQGREIARGLGEDRRAPAGAFADCLRKDHTALWVSPPGTNVGISFAVSYP